jgi:GNAT superfamily N-acetyltransferase
MRDQLVDVHIDELASEDAETAATMTFPAYRHLLALQPTMRMRLPWESEQRLVQPAALVARTWSRQAVGLALAELAVRDGDGPPELLSVFVAPERRREGIGAALVAAMEEMLRSRGAISVETVYMTGKPAIGAVERIFETRGWEPPSLRSVTVRFTMAEALSAPWYGRTRLPESAEIFSWKDLTDDERRQLRESNERAPWIPNGLQPWRHDHAGFDPISSVGLRYRGEVVGWVINHPIDSRMMRFTCSFMRKDLARRARILPLYSESIRRLSETSCECCTFITPPTYPEMLEFLRRHCSPYASFTAETRGTRKSLA